MILTELPDLLPRPETAANATFRREFYRKWGKGNWIVSGAAHRAEYSVFRQTLSLKCMEGGTETYFVDGRTIPVSDGNWLLLNEGREYGSLLEAPRAAFSFAIFFRPGMANEVAAGLGHNLSGLLDRGIEHAGCSVEFPEALQSDDKTITPAIRFIRRSISQGVRCEHWLEEQLLFLLHRILAQRSGRLELLRREFDGARPATLRELERRLGLATDYMRSSLAEELTLRDIAGAAMLSPCHLLRQFRRAFGKTPSAYLRELRLERAKALRQSGATWMDIAAETGLSRTTLWREGNDFPSPS